MNTFLFFPHQGFVFEDQGNVVLVWPLVPEATLWLHLITEALWPERAVFYNGALVVKTGGDWTATMLEIYLAGWRWSFSFLGSGRKPVASNGGGDRRSLN